MTFFISELRQAGRRLVRSPGFSTLAVVTLALALGSHVAIFSLIHRLFFAPLPVAEPEQLVEIFERRQGSGYFPLAYGDFLDHRAAIEVSEESVFTEIAAHYPSAPLDLRIPAASGRGSAVHREAQGSVVSANYFSLLGLSPTRGRFFDEREDEDRAGASPSPPVAVVSHDLWQSEWGGREGVLGAVVYLNATPFTVVGVAPAGFTGVRIGSPSEVWISTRQAEVGYRWCDPADRDCRFLLMLGRLDQGHSREEAQVETDLLARRLAQALPGERGDRGLVVASLTGVHPAARGQVRRLAGLLLLVVTAVLVVAAVNLGGLLLARATGRRRELATRLALGASRGRLAWGLMAETLLLSLAGGVGALGVATLLAPVVAALYPSPVPLELGLKPAVLGYAALLGLATGLAVGLLPGLLTSRATLRPAMDERRPPRLLEPLIVVQMTLSFLLLAGTGLLLNSLERFEVVGGLDPSTVATARLRPRLAGYGPAQAQAFLRQVEERVESLPGVRSVSLSTGLPPFRFFQPRTVERPGAPAPTGRGLHTWGDAVSAGAFDSLGVEVLQGRAFGPRDRVGGPAVAVVNRTLAHRLWPAGEAVGQTLRVDGEAMTVVGVVADAGYFDAGEPGVSQFYTPFWQDPEQIDARLTVRTRGEATPWLPEIRAVLQDIDPRVPVTEVATMRTRLREEFAAVFLAGRVLSLAGGLVVLLTALGLYSILALAVALAHRDYCIRLALGGRRPHVFGLIYRRSLTLGALAVGIGLLILFAISDALTPYLYGIGPRDPGVLGLTVIALAVLCATVAWRPAHRASRCDPATVLREP